MTDTIPFIKAEAVESQLRWKALLSVLEEGHRKPSGQIADILLRQGRKSLLNRAGWVEGIGAGVKAATIFPENAIAKPARATVQSLFLLFDESTGTPKAIIDGDLVTNWKTAGDSVLGARLLARENPRRLVVMGTGVLARGLVLAYSEIFPELELISIWSRNSEKTADFVKRFADHSISVRTVTDISNAVSGAEIVTTATSAATPILQGAWVSPGTHVDLVGAFLSDTREADDELITKGCLFVDSRETTLDHIGELKIPLDNQLISRSDIAGDLYDLVAGGNGRQSRDDVTVFKNGGGAHLDLMTASYIYETWQAQN